MESLGLGAIRLTSLFLQKIYHKPISSSTYETIKRHVKKKMVRFTERINKDKIELAFGSSGTIINLAEIACKMFDHEIDRNNLVLRYKELQKVIETLCSMPLEQRKQLPGINPDRADIIIGGAVILETFMEEFKLKELVVSYRDLRHGMLIDYLQKNKGFPEYQSMSVRESSVRHLCRLFNINENHANNVQLLCLELFDKTRTMGLHSYGEHERELLQYSSLLHDVGNIISFRGHHLHSYYIIQNAELLGFNQEEIMLMANIVRFHRKKLPRKKEQSFKELNKQEQQIVFYLSFLLRIAEKLDRSHSHMVQHVDISILDKNTICLTLHCADGGCDLEQWSIQNDKRLFEHVFNKKLVVDVQTLQGKKRVIEIINKQNNH
jgi:exopolyphosphatase/guanosine-5'-triphosphate,3'-diphosphate pyrophosphatase